MAKEVGSSANDSIKYRKLYNWGKTLILSGVIKHGEKFPSEHTLEKKFGYSRQTVRNALDRLEKEKLISRLRGSGTYVSYENENIDKEKKHIGLILSYFSDYLFPQVYDGIKSVLEEKGFVIDVAVTGNRLNDETIYLEGLLNSAVSGFIIEGTKSSFPNPNLRLYKEIRKRNIPTVFIHNHYSNQDFAGIEMSDAEAGYELTKYLIKNGHKRIGGLFKYDDIQGLERYRGFIECLSDYGIKFDDDYIRWYSTKDMEEKLSPKGFLKTYRRTRDCTAMIMYNDEVAYSYLDFLRNKGVNVPRDLSLASFDDARLAENEELKIFSVVHPKSELGRLAVRKLVKMLNDSHWQNKNYSHKFPVEFNDGNSVRDIKNHNRRKQ